MSRAEIDEIDALLRASELARTKVGERARKLYEEHDAVLSAMDRDLDVDKLAPARAVRARPGKDVPSAQHALLFHLAEGHAGATDAYAERQSKVPASAPPRAAPPPPEDAVVPKAPAYATPAEAKEWDEYYRFCARGALFSALDRGRETELELAQRLSAEVLGANDVDDWDDANVLAARRRRRAMENDVDKARRRQVADVTARFLAYEPRKTPVHGLEGKLRDCGLDLPSPADIVARAEADFLASRGLGPAALGATFLGSECGDAEPESSPKAAKKSKKLRAADAEARQQQKAADAEADRAARDARYRKATGVTEVEEMHAALARDAYVAVPMQRLPAAAGGGAVSAVVRGSTVRVDVAFPALEAYRRAEHDVAAYFMPSYTAHLSEPHGGGGGFWSQARADGRDGDSRHAPSGGRTPAKKKGKKTKKAAETTAADEDAPAAPVAPVTAAEALRAIFSRGSDAVFVDTVDAAGLQLAATLAHVPPAALACLRSDDVARAVAACAEALASALGDDAVGDDAVGDDAAVGDAVDASAPRLPRAAADAAADAQRLVARAVAEVLASPAAAGAWSRAACSAAPAAPECERWALLCAAARPRQALNLLDLVRFCGVAACVDAAATAEARLAARTAAAACAAAAAEIDGTDADAVARVAAGLFGSAFAVALDAAPPDAAAPPREWWDAIGRALRRDASLAHLAADVADVDDDDYGDDDAADAANDADADPRPSMAAAALRGAVKALAGWSARDAARLAVVRHLASVRRARATSSADASDAYALLRATPPGSTAALRDAVKHDAVVGAGLRGYEGICEAIFDFAAAPAAAACDSPAGYAALFGGDFFFANLRAPRPTPAQAVLFFDFFLGARGSVFRGAPPKLDDGTFFTYACIMALLDARRPAADADGSVGRASVDDESELCASFATETSRAPSAADAAADAVATEVLLVRALRHAVVGTSCAHGGHSSSQLDRSGGRDFGAAFAHLAGAGVASMAAAQCAPLLRPYAAHWGGRAGAALAARADAGADAARGADAAARRVASLLARATAGVVCAASLAAFVDQTAAAAPDAPDDAPAPEAVPREADRRDVWCVSRHEFASASISRCGEGWTVESTLFPGALRSSLALRAVDVPAHGGAAGGPPHERLSRRLVRVQPGTGALTPHAG